MEAIKETIKNVMRRLEAKKKAPARQSDPGRLLKKVLSKKEQGHSKLNYFKRGTLDISVDSSTWLYHFSLKKEGLLERLSQKSGVIKNIRFRIGEVK
jgi:hypothetical protein